ADCKAAPTNQTAAECGYSVIYALAPSPAKRGVIWAGTDDGLVWRTEDGGKHWHDVTPKGLADWSRIDTIEADPHDASSAYAAVDRHQVDDFAPYMYVTHDAGVHWRLAVAGIPRGDYVRVVRTDPERKGLLYAGTEQGVFVSFDDGRHWQSLQLNLPTASVHDLVVHGGDLVAATHGRGIWILDDIEPLREASAKVAKSAVHLYRPRPAYLFPLSLYHAEARPPEEPHAANPPTGAIIDYRLAQSAKGAVQLAIYDANGRLVRRYSSAAKPTKMPLANFPDYFKAPPTVLPATAGLNRFVWDFHYAPPLGVDPYWAGPAVLGRTPRGPLGPLAPPGTYRVVLTVNGAEYSAPLELIADPNLHAAAETLRANAAFALELEDALNRNAGLLARAEEAAKAADKTGDVARAKRIRAVLAQFDLDSVNGQLYGLMREVSSSAEAPTASAKADSAALEHKSERARAALAALLVPGM
ncbi:MAG TPA: glycoside hydrolase, partial [Gammaproteobacteria bacterium]|nr:glycoside hydrolase [Gammaproteobacteria bacterium]